MEKALNTFNGLPLYYMDMSLEKDGIKQIALVDKPAIERNFVMFNNVVKFSDHKDRRIISGAILIPDMPIYRRDKENGEYYVMFTKDMCEKALIKLGKQGFNNLFNKQHTEESADGVQLFEIFQIDKDRGIKAPVNFEDLNDGSIFGSAKIESDEIWNEYLKTGVFKGFSIEGMFDVKASKPQESELSLIDRLRNILQSSDK